MLYFLLTRQVILLNIDPDMNAELKAHGYSNAISGLFGGAFEQIFS
jgi:MFS superfamily sulfate permease-like transporter